MPLRKRINREKLFGESQQEVRETQGDDAHSDKDEGLNPAAGTREMRRRERPHKPKEMSEEEMMALALRLSEQEANVTAQRVQEEEAAVKKALKDSMFNDSQSLVDDAPLCIASRRKLVYSNGESQAEAAESGAQEGRGQRGHLTRTRKRRQGEGSPLMEMPNMSQTQPSPSSPESVALGSPQSCDSTQIEDCDLPKSPVFPSSTSAQGQVSVQMPRLDQNLLDSCATSGFVLCSQDSGALTETFHRHVRSPTFPKSPGLSSKNPTAKSKTHPQTEILDLGDETQPDPSSAMCKSPVFGQRDSKSALKSDPSEAAALVFSSQESSASSCPEKDVNLIKSPVFPKTQRGPDRVAESGRQSPRFGTDKRTERTREDDGEDTQQNSNTWNLSEREPTCDMTLHWSDEDNATPVASPSPVFPEEKSVPQNDDQTVSENQEPAPTGNHCRAAGPQDQSEAEAPGLSGGATPQATVHYYWGVPFCPRGLDPNDYTKVIVAQLEVYEKSLKRAQRGLLNKVTWGEPVLPQPEKSPSPESNSPQIHLQTRRSRRRKGKLKEPESDEELVEVTEETQTSPREEEEEEERDESAAEEETRKETGKETRKETRKETGKETGKETRKETGKETRKETGKETRKETGKETRKEREGKPSEEQVPLEDLNEDETQVESDCEVCPETQLSDNDLTQELPLPSRPAVRSPESQVVQVDSPNVAEPEQDERQEPMETGPESQEEPALSKPSAVGSRSSESQSRQDPGPHRSQSPDLDRDRAPGPEAPVQCPICQRAFPSDQIEMHAAFCDGEPAAAGARASPKPRRKRTRREEGGDSDHTDSEPGGAQEKCYICHRAIPVRDYARHTERCLQRKGPRTAAVRSAAPSFNVTAVPKSGGLLSALDQSEHKDPRAGPSGSTLQQEVIDLIDDDEDEDENSVSLIPVSNSPIRSFTSISEAQDCLIDFRTQHPGKRPRPRLGTKPGPKRR